MLFLLTKNEIRMPGSEAGGSSILLRSCKISWQYNPWRLMHILDFYDWRKTPESMVRKSQLRY
jgi:hypothetical protein